MLSEKLVDSLKAKHAARFFQQLVSELIITIP